MSTPIARVSVYLMTPSLPEGCAPDALIEATAEGLRATGRFDAVDVHRGEEPPAGHRVGIRIGKMQTTFGEMPQIELLLHDPSGAVVEEVEPFGTQSDLPGAAAELAIQFADEALYPALMAARGFTGKFEHPRRRYSNEEDATLMAAALLANLTKDLARGRELAGTPMPPTFHRLVEVGESKANAVLLFLAAEILSLWGDATEVLAVLLKGHGALPEEKRPALARRLHGAVRQARQGAELASMLVHLGALPGDFTPNNPRKHAVLRWLSITGVLSGDKPDVLQDLEDAVGAAWARLPALGIALAKPTPDEQFSSLLHACRPALAALGLATEVRSLAEAAGDASRWRAAADAFLRSAAEAAPLLSVEPWWRYAKIGRAGAPKARRLLEEAIERSPRSAFLHEILGLEHLCRGDFGRAIERLTDAIALDPDSANAFNLRGASLSDQGTRVDDAVRDLDRAIELDPGVALAWSNRAKTVYRLKDLGAALHDIDYALRLAPGHDDSSRFRMTLLLELQRHHEVVAAADQFLSKRQSPEVLIKRGTAKLHLGDLDDALADLDAGIELTPLEDGFFFRGRVHLASGRLDAAERDVRFLLDNNVGEARRNECKELLAEIEARRGSIPPDDNRPWWKKIFG
jgi:tetratricopeptide (TPR) repeat protein